MTLSQSMTFYYASGMGIVGFLPHSVDAPQISVHKPQNNSYTTNSESKIPKKEDEIFKRH